MLKVDFKKCYSFLIVIVVLLLNVNIQAQTFERIEGVSGFELLNKNSGVAVADYDGDLDLDIFVVANDADEEGKPNTLSRLYRNNNDGSFTDVTAEAGFRDLLSLEDVGRTFFGLRGYKFGASWGDYDNDGFPDLFFTHLKKIQLFRNQGDGTFLDVTNDASLPVNNDCNNTGATWVDYNNDGFLDLFVSDWKGSCGGNSLYKNNGDGTFTDASEESGIRSLPNLESFTMFPYDFNSDGWLDFYICNDLDNANRLFINNEGVNFSEQANSYGLDSMLDNMGITIGDIENDGDFDFFTTGINENDLLVNQGSNSFSEMADAFNVKNTDWAWGTKFADFDLDGDEDLVIVNGFMNVGNQPNYYFKNLFKENGNSFQNISEELGLNEESISVEVVDFDYDFDGDLDLFITNTDRGPFFYENKIINQNEGNLNWLQVKLEGTTSNKDALGTKLIVDTDEGRIIRYYNGVGFLSQSLKPVHFGLNQSNLISELTIEWPSGLIEKHQNISANSFIQVTEGQGFQVLNITPSVKVSGCTDPNACNYNPMAVTSDGNCEYYASGNTVDGATNSGFNKVEVYTFSSDVNVKANWQVEGGEILDGQGSNAILVKWALGAEGRVEAIEITDSCISEPRELNVTLSIGNIPENVSIARIWNEALLEAIRNDYARPTVHARNLFHTSIALYDCWAIYDEIARPYLIGNTVGEFSSSLEEFTPSEDTKESQEKAMSYAAYRVLRHRFINSPSSEESLALFDYVMEELGFDVGDVTTEYTSGNAIALGNYVAEVIINYGNTDESREGTAYDNAFYEPVNEPLELSVSEENSNLVDANRWQPLTFNTFIDQSGNIIEGDTPEFLSPEWGKVAPFALSNEDKTIFRRGADDYTVYHDPGAPPLLDIENGNSSSDLYKWNFSLVSIWSAHLDPTDGVLWDISPKNIGNIDIASFPNSFDEYPNFYKEIEGGDISVGRSVNPKTGEAYASQMVPRADYARVLAEFWADGPDSETPPGHWFTILNYVSDHERLQRKFNGEGEELAPLEWDVKSYFILAGAMHDAAITAWGIKGWYDYIRPISAIRYMSALGQSSDQSLSNYHVGGIPLKEGYVEVVNEGDALSGINNENVGEIKLFAWRGHKFINNPSTDVAGVGWILAKDWFPYQRPSFVTPPFAGYLSGHSTYSRAAAEVLTLITGDEYFPGGLGEFVAKKDEFLVFEKGPSIDVVLQWATYRDASNQTSLSRIWGGIHPPADDILGRQIGAKVGVDAYNFAVPYFSGAKVIAPTETERYILYPNPVENDEINVANTKDLDDFKLFNMIGRNIKIIGKNFDASSNITTIVLPRLPTGIYILKVNKEAFLVAQKNQL
ncbi:putative secreted protein (Por secretion system target) [Maribacter vaceletii]|uniref:Putative secreted protein (Por secretion system target) n=1 Tax=Maribacter vaceletii TaxID=1206816 RepID=A0A495EEG5_9FLAO|nr:FG-GAP-like repeat-containing protein [Maribacter vaceletii]RKR15059.1 putative secreted protein (Por secretion system target) [Maribacter vaceletii]